MKYIALDQHGCVERICGNSQNLTITSMDGIFTSLINPTGALSARIVKTKPNVTIVTINVRSTMKTETELRKIVHHDTQGVDVTTEYYDEKVKFIMLRVKSGNSIAVLTPGEAQAAIELLTHALKELNENRNS